MRLRKIKLSGFKSFVDPTTLHVPGNLVGVVGPNGCGKSNIIDAVTWVMGESSAKHLRGESMTDVIFNGSAARQPVGQASVELCFDNTEGKAGGEYAKFSELSIKRIVNRDAISTYYLNGTRCRRRDITSIFLGTGLGPRSYSIIEQGMISRLIEAKPEDLRSFIEEAAGISKYRERRRETENRIRHTRENLERLNDIQEELTKQLAHLDRQAKAAEKFNELKKQERKLKAELLALKWKQLKDKTESDEKITLEAQNRLEEVIAQMRATEAEIEQQRVVLNESNERLNTIQSSHYQLAADISQLEQSIKHTQHEIETTRSEIAQGEEEISKLKLQRNHDEETLKKLNLEFAELQPRLDGSRTESDKAYEYLNTSEHAMQAWQSEWEQFNFSAMEAETTRQKNINREEYLKTSLEDSNFRVQQLQSELENIDINMPQQQIAEFRPKLNKLEQDLELKRQALQKHKEELQVTRQEIEQFQQKQEVQRNSLQETTIRIETLDAIQKNLLGEDNDKRQNWLEMHGLSSKPRLASTLVVESDWAIALETVLTDHLQSVFLDKDDVNHLLADLDASFTMGFWTESLGKVAQTGKKLPTLAEKVSQPQSLKNYLARIYLAESEDQAFEIAHTLESDESVITRKGLWIGKSWSQLKSREQSTGSVIEREQELQKLQNVFHQQQKSLQDIENELSEKKQSHQNQEHSIDALLRDIESGQEDFTHLHTQLVKEESKLEDLESRSERCQLELDDLQQQCEAFSSELKGIAESVQSDASEKQLMEAQKNELITLRQQHQESLEQARSRWQATHEESHGIALKLEAITSQKASLDLAIKRTDTQIQNIENRIEQQKQKQNLKKEPLEGMQQNLEVKLNGRVESEKRVSIAREELQTFENKLRDLEKSRHETENKITGLREEVEKQRLRSQESIIRLQTTEEQLDALDRSPAAVLESLDREANIDEWQKQLDATERKIQRLGPINLAAIDEHKQLSERKQYLDSQESDLKDALETLESAIRKIDKETRTRFKETFDKLNGNLKELFPQLVGGGSAYLELTGDDLLDTGVTVMARPPGKKNSSIHLLSGGEKAMTAVALVFSIFKLNPAPFCILDEVDAPLDDNNTARFSEMVQSMSADVQFLFITHNKITMEIAQQLLGVTMNEPGVSRLVSVDVDAAVEMAESA